MSFIKQYAGEICDGCVVNIGTWRFLIRDRTKGLCSGSKQKSRPPWNEYNFAWFNNKAHSNGFSDLSELCWPRYELCYTDITTQSSEYVHLKQSPIPNISRSSKRPVDQETDINPTGVMTSLLATPLSTQRMCFRMTKLYIAQAVVYTSAIVSTDLGLARSGSTCQEHAELLIDELHKRARFSTNLQTHYQNIKLIYFTQPVTGFTHGTYKLTTNGWSILARIFFSFCTCSTCLSRITSLMFMILRALYSAVRLSLQSRTRPKVPVPAKYGTIQGERNSLNWANKHS